MLKKLLLASLLFIVLIPPLRADSCTLQKLTVSHGTLTPAFSSEIHSYQVKVAYTLETITLDFQVSQSDAAVIVNGLTVYGGQGSVPIQLKWDVTSIMMTIQPADGSVAESYTVTVLKEGYLTGLTLQSGTGNMPVRPSFNSRTHSYTATVGPDIRWVTVTPTTHQGMIKVNNAEVASGASSGPIDLSFGFNNITIEINSSDGMMEDRYTIQVFREGYLTGLTLQSGPAILPVIPEFSSTSFSYTANVASDVACLTVTPSASQGIIKVNGMIIPNGQPSPAITLLPESTIITLEITSADGLEKVTYTINVNKPRISTYLSNLTLTFRGASLTPSFVRTTFNYTAIVRPTTTTITVTPTAEDSNSIIKVNGVIIPSGQVSGPIYLNTGDNIITIAVINSDGSAQSIYTVNVIKP